LVEVQQSSKNKNKSLSFFIASLACGALIVAVNIYGFFLLKYRSGLPPEINVKNIIKIDNFQIESEKDIEFILSQKQIGEKAEFLIKTENGNVEFFSFNPSLRR